MEGGENDKTIPGRPARPGERREGGREGRLRSGGSKEDMPRKTKEDGRNATTRQTAERRGDREERKRRMEGTPRQDRQRRRGGTGEARTGTTRAVHVLLQRGGYVQVHHVREAGDVDPSCGHLSRDADTEPPARQPACRRGGREGGREGFRDLKVRYEGREGGREGGKEGGLTQSVGACLFVAVT